MFVVGRGDLDLRMTGIVRVALRRFGGRLARGRGESEEGLRQERLGLLDHPVVRLRAVRRERKLWLAT